MRVTDREREPEIVFYQTIVLTYEDRTNETLFSAELLVNPTFVSSQSVLTYGQTSDPGKPNRFPSSFSITKLTHHHIRYEYK